MIKSTLFNDRFMDGLFDTFFDSLSGSLGSTRQAMDTDQTSLTIGSAMRTDVMETETGYELAIDLPGHKKENVRASLEDGYLIIKATVDNESEEEAPDGKYIRRERYFGSCSRSFYVGDLVTEEDIKAKFEDGVLKLMVPKKTPEPEQETKKNINIE